MPQRVLIAGKNGTGNAVSASITPNGYNALDVVVWAARPVSYRYKQITTSGSTIETIWKPSSDKCLRLISFIISCDGTNDVALVFGTSTLCYLFFGEKKAVPLSIPFELCGGTGEPLKAFVSSTGTVTITAIGYEG